MTNILIKKLYFDKIKFVTSEELKNYSKLLEIDFRKTLNYLLTKGYLIRIFKGIFYVKSLDEKKFNELKFTPFEIVAKGLELKKVKNWYFGSYTALKLNNLTYESTNINYIINDKLFRRKPINILGYKFKFIKIKEKLLSFGIIKRGKIKYSDPEKTILDLIYLWKYNGVEKERIIMNASELVEKVSKSKLREYSKFYPKTVQMIIEEIL